jgi:hypothetical protein
MSGVVAVGIMEVGAFSEGMVMEESKGVLVDDGLVVGIDVGSTTLVGDTIVVRGKSSILGKEASEDPKPANRMAMIRSKNIQRVCFISLLMFCDLVQNHEIHRQVQENAKKPCWNAWDTRY